MKPLKFSEVVIETAVATGLPEEIVGALLRLYFKEVRGALSSLEHPRVRVCNLGTFCAKPKAVERRLQRRAMLLQRLSGLTGTRNDAIRADTLQEVEQLRYVLDCMEHERERRKRLKDF
jgi:hypothetical protein